MADNKGVWRINKEKRSQVVFALPQEEYYRICSDKNSKSTVTIEYVIYVKNGMQTRTETLHPSNCIDLLARKITIIAEEDDSDESHGIYFKMSYEDRV